MHTIDKSCTTYLHHTSLSHTVSTLYAISDFNNLFVFSNASVCAHTVYVDVDISIRVV